jgi:hypothetical protein
MFCFKCGGAMSDDANSCPSCGTARPVMAGTMESLAPGNVPPGNALPVVSPQIAAVPQVAMPQTAVPQTEDKAVISLVLGILSLVGLSVLGGIPAIILGKMSRNNIRASSGRLGGEGMATAGIIMGWVSVGLAVLFLLLMVLMVFYLIPSH